jgi:5-methylcytosine-specific restriction endonuclease McrA
MRDYKKEYRDFHGKPEQRKARSMRNQARRKLQLKKGDPREVDHKRPLSKNLKNGNQRSNLRAVSRETNRKKGSLSDAMRKLAAGYSKATRKKQKSK